jgi:uroporphyrinogen III methyltransferase/synthase
VPLPLIRIEPVEDWMGELSAYDWVLFTSVNGVEHFFRRAGESALHAKIGAVGPTTAEALRSRGLAPAFQPAEQTGAALAQGIADLEGSALPSCRILIPCAADASESTARILREAGASVEELPVYRTVPDDPAAEDLARVSKGVDAVVFMSGSAARAFRALVERTPSLAPAFEHAVVACIGPSTAESAHAAGLRVDIVPGEHTSEALVTALADRFSAKAGR